MTYKKENGAISLESASFVDGRILKTGSSYALHYHLTDHLGSVRVIFDNGGNTLAENDYYPFGLRHANPGSRETPTNRFLYNGKEAQRTGGLDYLNYGARMYDAGLGRWFGIDLILLPNFRLVWGYLLLIVEEVLVNDSGWLNVVLVIKTDKVNQNSFPLSFCFLAQIFYLCAIGCTNLTDRIAA